MNFQNFNLHFRIKWVDAPCARTVTGSGMVPEPGTIYLLSDLQGGIVRTIPGPIDEPLIHLPHVYMHLTCAMSMKERTVTIRGKGLFTLNTEYLFIVH